ncbi:hypothetical protein RHMOL_Rhmol05G0000200 [Rhododendron molle]|uniref:Uncharacterized protein n=1 Tax=Rhododendron molle TaxID=49168 RepID=A0ACC0NJS1_RHOML|nr:hypothetical protein RHMOL_Rhmol05G0000200 [Rhododendron molle]
MLDSNNAITDNGAEVKTQGAAEVGDNVEVASGSPLPGVKDKFGDLYKLFLLVNPEDDKSIAVVVPRRTLQPETAVDNDDIDDDDGDGNSDMTTTTMTFQTRKLDKR